MGWTQNDNRIEKILKAGKVGCFCFDISIDQDRCSHEEEFEELLTVYIDKYHSGVTL